MTTFRITHDPQSGAFYIRLREGDYHETIPLGDPGLGAGVDVDSAGNVLGLEFLSFEEFAEVIADRGGALEVPEMIGRLVEGVGRATDQATDVEARIDGEEARSERPRRRV